MRRYGNIRIYDGIVLEVQNGSEGVVALPLSSVTYKIGVYGNADPGAVISGVRPTDDQFGDVNGYPAKVGAVCTVRLNVSTGETTVWNLLERPRVKDCSPGTPSNPARSVFLNSDQLRALLGGEGA